MKTKLSWIVCGVVGLVLASALPGFSLPIVDFAEALDSGGYRYEFTLRGTVPTDNTYELFLDIAANVLDISQVMAPAGWGSITDPSLPGLLAYGDNGPGRTFVDAIADPGYELVGVASLSGFGFTSATRITEPILFSWNFDPANLGQARLNDGPDPNPVPEPATFVLMASGLLGVAMVLRRRKS